MSLEVYIGFVLASSLILIIPGPTVILVVSQAIAHGRKSVAPLVAGVVAGDFTAMTMSLLGLGTLLAASARLFTLLKWIGALYLIYLGIKLWTSDAKRLQLQVNAADRSARELFRSSFIVTALNPKSITFFVAFLPQFINPNSSTIMQLPLLGVTFLVLAGVNGALYGIFAGRFNDYMKRDRVRRWLNRGGGAALIGAGIITARLKG